MNRIRIGVIGVGYWGRKHVEEYTHLDFVDMRMIADVSTKNLKEVQELYGVPQTTTDYRELLASDGIDAVSVCVDNNSHYEVCKAALEAGKHVLVEKPMTMKSETAKELVDIARSKDQVLAVGHIFRFNNAINKVRELVKEKFFGKLYYMKLQWTTTFPSPEGRDILFDLAPHSFDIVNYILDEWPSHIYALARPYRRDELEEAGYVLAEFRDNVMGHIEISWLEPGKVRTVTIIGSERQAVIECLSQKVRVYESGYDYELDIERNNTLKDELIHFVNCINNHALATNSGEVGVKTVRMIEKAMESMKTGCRVETGE